MFAYTIAFVRNGSDYVETVNFICPDFATAFELATFDGIEILSIVKGAAFKF